MKKRLIILLLALCLCCGLSVPGLAASEETASSIDVFVTELDAGYYLCAVWDGDTMLCLFDYTVGSDGVLKTTVDVGEALPAGTQVKVGISSANAGGKEIAPVVCSAYTPSDEPAKPTEPTKPLYYISVRNVSGGLVTVPAQSCYAGDYVPLSVYPSRGYELRNIFVTDRAGNRVPVRYTGGQYWFTMPSSNVTVYAEFAATSPTVSSSPSASTSSRPAASPEISVQPPLTLNVFASKLGPIRKTSYSIDFSLSANVTGGAGSGYSYLFEIKQNGRVTRSSGWTNNSIFSGYLSGGGTCVAEISVKDAAGQTVSASLDLLGESCSAFASSPGAVIVADPARPSNSGSGSTSTPSSTPSSGAESLSIGISKSAAKYIVGSSYDIQFKLAAFASGGDGSYSYKFIILQNGEVTESTDWSSLNAISATLSGNGTCVVEIHVKDASGETASTTVDLLE